MPRQRYLYGAEHFGLFADLSNSTSQSPPKPLERERKKTKRKRKRSKRDDESISFWKDDANASRIKEKIEMLIFFWGVFFFSFVKQYCSIRNGINYFHFVGRTYVRCSRSISYRSGISLIGNTRFANLDSSLESRDGEKKRIKWKERRNLDRNICANRPPALADDSGRALVGCARFANRSPTTGGCLLNAVRGNSSFDPTRRLPPCISGRYL